MSAAVSEAAGHAFSIYGEAAKTLASFNYGQMFDNAAKAVGKLIGTGELVNN
jgi:hypothetical protein